MYRNLKFLHMTDFFSTDTVLVSVTNIRYAQALSKDSLSLSKDSLCARQSRLLQPEAAARCGRESVGNTWSCSMLMMNNLIMTLMMHWFHSAYPTDGPSLCWNGLCLSVCHQFNFSTEGTFRSLWKDVRPHILTLEYACLSVRPCPSPKGPRAITLSNG